MKKCFLALFVFILTMSAAAQIQIRGVVRSGQDQLALIGANVLVKGSSNGTVTDTDGKFELTVPNGSTFEVSYLGFETQLITVKDQNTTIEVILLENASALNEIVVTSLGIEKEKSRVGFAIQTIKGADLIKAREPNPVNSLVGKVAGLTVGASAEILGAPQVLLRGSSNILYVVDGVPIQSDTWNISPDDIESITVLKGPNASALYGSRGQFGAIQITTKRGTKDSRGFTVEFNSSTMMENGFLTIPKVQDEYGPGDHGRYAFKDGKGGGLNDGDYDIWGPKFEGQSISQYDSPVNPVTGERQGTPWVNRGADNLSRFLRSGILSTNNLAISAGNSTYDLRFSATQIYQKGIVPNTQLNGSNFSITSGLNFNKKLRFESSINYSRQYTPNIPDIQYGPNSIIYNMIIWGGADWDVDDMRNYWQEGKEGLQQNYAEYQRYNNPYFQAYEWTRGHYKNDIYGTIGLTYKFDDFLSMTGRTQITGYDLFRTEKFPYSGTSYGREARLGDYREDNRNLFENNSDLLVTYKRPVGNDFSLNLSVGASARNFTYNSNYASTDYLNVPGWYNLNNSLYPKRVFNYNSDMKILSAYSFLDLSYQNILNLSLTGRVDKNSTLPINNNSFFYPSVSLSFVLSEAIKMPKYLPYIKLRGSYANVGSGLTQTNIGPADRAAGADITGYGIDYNTPYGGPDFSKSAAYSIANRYNSQPSASYANFIANPDLQPSISSSWEAGTDLRFFQNRLGIDFTYFKSINGPGIFNLPISEASGYNSLVQNGIKFEKSGVELSVTGSPVKSDVFEWNVLANWSTYKDVLSEIYPGVTTYNQFLKVGDRLDKFYSTKVYRTSDGQIINDGGGRPRVNPVPQYMGDLNPDWAWGLVNTLRYKNVALSFQVDGRVGGVIVNYIQKQTFRGGRNIETIEGALGEARYQDYKGIKSYVGEGVQLSGGVIKTDVNGTILNYNELQFKPNTTPTFLQDYISRWYSTNEANLIDRTYAKLREATLTFTLPQSLFKNSIFQSATISLIGRNLLLVSHARNNDLDVDQFASGQTESSLQTPTTRRYGLNLNIKF
ncbi:MAG: SusC/RagA family TonB-linked outer membrane protein [Saprospiraceae bacterium]|nr:SusC/RagA family TonB-linked outer membrane protein [Saprospiraceae bacterium]